MRKIVFILIIVTTLISVLSILFMTGKSDEPYKLAKSESGLKLPKDMQLIEHKSQWIEFNGNGYVLVVYGLKKDEINLLIDEAKNEKYETLPPETLIADDFVLSYIKKAKKGVYQKKSNSKSSLDYSLSVIDETNNRLIVFVTAD